MKVKGLRWMVIGLIMLITIINYLDRGTLNYMWVANIDYHLVSEADASADKGNHAVLAGEQYILTAANGNRDSVSVANVQMKEKNGVTFVTNREGIAIDLGLIDRNDPDASQKAKDILGLITIFFMIAYGISQLVSGKLYDKIGCRKGFFWSVLVWGAADALASLSRGIFSLTFFRMMLGLGEAGPWPGTTKSNAEWFPQKERAFAQGLFGAAASIGSILAPIIILMLFIAFGWKLTFIVVGGLGLIWLIPWLIINKEGPKKHPWITEEERTYILSGQPEQELKTEDKGKISTNDIVAYIRQVIFNAKIDGRKSVVILAKDVHNALGLVSRYPMVCNAMRKCMNDGDKVLFSPTSGYSSTLKIEYFTACVKTNEQTEDRV